MDDRKPKEMRASTARTQTLLDNLMEKGFSDRSGEWFEDSMFEPVGNENLPIIERRAISFRIMLEAMVSEENSKTTRTYDILPGELIVGNMPMGSVGLGKVYPCYFSEEEKRLLTVTNRDMQSTFGHNIPDYGKLLSVGLSGIIQEAENKLFEVKSNRKCTHFRRLNSESFYKSVLICCKAVVAYSEAMARLAEGVAGKESDIVRKNELIKMAEICRRVPLKPAETFYEAVQSIYTVHLAYHSTMDFISLGRLDQLLEPYYLKDMENGLIDEAKALELIECLLIKCAGRINLNPEFFLKQDHSSFGGVFGDSPVFLDQIASANNFLQNIAVGGVQRDGRDASNNCTKLILRACGNLALPTPVVNIRIGSSTSKEIIDEAVTALRKSKNGIPVIYNDEIIIKAMESSGFPIEECRDYGVDGCWEPILNAKGDWVFGMFNMLTVLECALNSGCTFSTERSLLRGSKISYIVKDASKINSFDELIDNVKVIMQFFIDRIILTALSFYNVEGSVNPTPFLSALLDGCMKRGMDKTWGGAHYHLTGALAVAMPNCANALANIKKYVFEDKKYTLSQVVDALKRNFHGYEKMRKTFLNSPYKFGNNVELVDNITKKLLDLYYEAADSALKLGNEVFVKKPLRKEKDRIISNRSICHYDGPSMDEKYNGKFKMHYTLGCGTFGQYTLMGKSIGASADGRERGDPLTPNFSPIPGTIKNGFANSMVSMNALGLDRFSAGVAVDYCMEDAEEIESNDYYINLIKAFINNKGSIMTITFIEIDKLNRIYEICEDVRKGKYSYEKLRAYSNISVRVGGFNAPFITLPREQQLNYIDRLKNNY